MNQVESLKNAWIFDKKGTLKETKIPEDKERAPAILKVAKEALRYAPAFLQDD